MAHHPNPDHGTCSATTRSHTFCSFGMASAWRFVCLRSSCTACEKGWLHARRCLPAPPPGRRSRPVRAIGERSDAGRTAVSYKAVPRGLEPDPARSACVRPSPETQQQTHPAWTTASERIRIAHGGLDRAHGCADRVGRITRGQADGPRYRALRGYGEGTPLMTACPHLEGWGQGAGRGLWPNGKWRCRWLADMVDVAREPAVLRAARTRPPRRRRRRWASLPVPMRATPSRPWRRSPPAARARARGSRPPARFSTGPSDGRSRCLLMRSSRRETRSGYCLTKLTVEAAARPSSSPTRPRSAAGTTNKAVRRSETTGPFDQRSVDGIKSRRWIAHVEAAHTAAIDPADDRYDDGGIGRATPAMGRGRRRRAVPKVEARPPAQRTTRRK